MKCEQLYDRSVRKVAKIWVIILGDKHAGFYNSNEYLGGVNYYLANSRNYRINFQYINVNRSPVSSTFGYYVGGQKGETITLAMPIFF